MDKKLEAEWYLDVEGAKTGPYTAEQIHGLYEDQEILAHHRVTCDQMNGEWISVSELSAAFIASTSTTPEEKPAFTPPPRPTELTKPVQPAQETTATKKQDPAASLFDALQAAKEKKTAAKLQTPASNEWGKPIRKWKRLPPQIWFILTLAIVITISVAGLVKILRGISARKAEQTPTQMQTQAQTPHNQLAPAQHQIQPPPAQHQIQPPPAPAQVYRREDIQDMQGGAIREGDPVINENHGMEPPPPPTEAPGADPMPPATMEAPAEAVPGSPPMMEP